MFGSGSNDNPEVIRTLIEAGADVTAKDMSEKTALDYIKENEYLKDTDAYWILNDAYWKQKWAPKS